MNPDEQNVEELSLKEQIDVLINDLPLPLQQFLRSSKRDQISLQLTQKYGLHADQGGAFDRAYLYMLLGVYSPDDFVQDLKEAGIPNETISALTADINELVFKPLQKQERQAPTPPAAASVPPPAATPAPFAPPPMSAPVPQPELVPKAASMAQAVVHTMAHDMQEAKEHPEPLPPAPKPFQPASPARSFQTASIPITAPVQPHVFTPTAPAVAPVPPSTQPVPSPAPRPVPPPPTNLPGQPPIYSVTPVPPTPSSAPTPIVKQYSVDPYRETPE